jgi:hypothetical protein
LKVDLILSRVEKAKRTGADSWVCCCPAHEDRNPSMTVRELDDGRILIHCFAGCSVEEILSSLGLSFDALFPDKPIEYAKPLRRPFPAADVLECLAFETSIVVMASGDLLRGKAISDVDRARLIVAAARIEDGRKIALG